MIAPCAGFGKRGLPSAPRRGILPGSPQKGGALFTSGSDQHEQTTRTLSADRAQHPEKNSTRCSGRRSSPPSSSTNSLPPATGSRCASPAARTPCSWPSSCSCCSGTATCRSRSLISSWTPATTPSTGRRSRATRRCCTSRSRSLRRIFSMSRAASSSHRATSARVCAAAISTARRASSAATRSPLATTSATWSRRPSWACSTARSCRPCRRSCAAAISGHGAHPPHVLHPRGRHHRLAAL